MLGYNGTRLLALFSYTTGTFQGLFFFTTPILRVTLAHFFYTLQTLFPWWKEKYPHTKKKKKKRQREKTTPNNKIASGQLILKHKRPTTAHALRDIAHESFYYYFIYIHFFYIIKLLLLS